jgi:hypothetical protein
MKLFITLSITALVWLGSFLIQPTVTARTSGSPGGFTGSVSETKTCGSGGGCHGGGFSNSAGMISSDIPSTGYVPGAVYQVTITLSKANKVKYGYEISAENSVGDKQGTFVNLDTKSKVLSNKNATHQGSGTSFSSMTASWTLQWTAPITEVGAITFSTVVNASNNSSNTGGDDIYMDKNTVLASTVSIDKNQLVDINVYPNPTSDFIHVKGLANNAFFTLYDQYGKQILNTQISSTAPIDIQFLPIGAYLVKIKQGEFEVSEWIIKK